VTGGDVFAYADSAFSDSIETDVDGTVYLAIDGDVFVYDRFARDQASFVSLPVAQQLVFDRSKTGCTLLE
jgi:hypothetical protein